MRKNNAVYGWREFEDFRKRYYLSVACSNLYQDDFALSADLPLADE